MLPPTPGTRPQGRWMSIPSGRISPRTDAKHEDLRHADLGEREGGANHERIGDDANSRADPTPPGEVPTTRRSENPHDQGA
jgi:hypothetical protein